MFERVESPRVVPVLAEFLLISMSVLVSRRVKRNLQRDTIASL